MTAILAFLLATTLKGSLLALLVVTVQALFRRRLSAAAIYTLWGLVALRLLMPTGLQTPWSLLSWAEITPSRIEIYLAGMDKGSGLSARNESQEPDQASPSSLPALGLAGLWMVGALGWVVISLVSTRRFLRLLSRRPISPRLRERWSRACRRVGIPEASIREGPDRGGAGILGFLHPIVVIPGALVESLDDDQLDHILLHEACHLKRRDPWHLAFGRLLQAIHWFNPLIHWAQERARADRELACDERALAILPRCQHRSYGLTLLRALHQSGAQPIHPPALSLGLAQRPHELERRISMIAESRPSTRLRLALAALVTLAIAGVGLTDITGNEPSIPPIPGKTEASGRVILIPTEEGVQILVDQDRERKSISVIDLLGAPLESDGALCLDEAIVDWSMSSEKGVTIQGSDISLALAFTRIWHSFTPREQTPFASTAPCSSIASIRPIDLKIEPAPPGDPITMSLKDAQLGDILSTLERMIGLEIDTSAVDTGGLVTLELEDEPWEEGLKQLLEQNHLRYERHGDRIVVLEE